MQCPHRAVLIETRSVIGTASNVAKRRVELQCSLSAGHEVPHRDDQHREEWTDRGPLLTTVLRHEPDDEL